MLYRWLVFFHLVGAFGFLLSHGISVSVAVGLRREWDPGAVGLLLRLSAGMRSLMYGSLALLLAGGVAAGLVGSWWGKGWIWAALVLLVMLVAVVAVGAVPYFRRVRVAVARVKEETRGEGCAAAELAALLASPVPLIVSAAGGAVLLATLSLMVFKPF